MSLLLDLAEYDGKSVEVLERIRDRYPPDSELLSQLVPLAAAEDTNVQAGATWLLRAHLRLGVAAGAADVRTLASLLGEITSPWAKLHVCQSLEHLEVPEEDADRFADFLRACVADPNTFVRAWATDGFCRLASTHRHLASEAKALLESALADPAASVRARARRTLSDGVI